jgi:hypothetical protein
MLLRHSVELMNVMKHLDEWCSSCCIGHGLDDTSDRLKYSTDWSC